MLVFLNNADVPRRPGAVPLRGDVGDLQIAGDDEGDPEGRRLATVFPQFQPDLLGLMRTT